MAFLAPKSLALPLNPGAMLAVAAVFAAGLTLGAMIGTRGSAPAPALAPARPAPMPALQSAYPADVLRVVDGDTFDARIRVWPGMEAVTRVRLRGIDAPEMKGRCEDERLKAAAAREALSRMLRAGGVGITNVAQDKYGGRVDADASAAGTPDVGEALIVLGLTRRYDGGRRAGWCG